MEKLELRPAYIALELMPIEHVQQQLDELKISLLAANRFSVPKRFFPHVLKLAGQQLTGSGLSIMLAEAVDDYSRARQGSNQDYAVRRILSELPDYIRILMPEGPELDDTLELYSGIMAQQQLDTGQILSEPENELEYPDYRKGAPKRIKTIIDTPEYQRTPAQQKALQKYLMQLGGISLKVHQPSQRELARRQAERENSHFDQ